MFLGFSKVRSSRIGIRIQLKPDIYRLDMTEKENLRLLAVITHPMSAYYLMRGQLAYLRESGLDVTLVSSGGELLQKTADREGVKFIPVDMRREPSPRKDLLALIKLWRVIRQVKPHILHYSTPKAGLLGSVSGILTRAPVRLYTLRGLRADGFVGAKAFFMRLLECIPCFLSHRTICVSSSLHQRVIELSIASQRKLCVLRPESSNGIDTQRFARSPAVLKKSEELRISLSLPVHCPVIVFVGRCGCDKGIVELVHAYQLLREKHPDLRLLIVGPDESNGALPVATRLALQNDGGIIRTGRMEDPRPAYALSTLLAFPSYREGFPNVPLEAAAMELPVVATEVVGCVDAVVHGVTGTLVPVKDSLALTVAIDRYLLDADLCVLHGSAGRERAIADFEQRLAWDALCDIYSELLTARGVDCSLLSHNDNLLVEK